MQRALIQYRDPKNYRLVREALQRAHREDLIGYGKKCLIRPTPPEGKGQVKSKREEGKGVVSAARTNRNKASKKGK